MNITPPCRLCMDTGVIEFVARLREQGHGYKQCYRLLKRAGLEYSRSEVQQHCAHVIRNIMSSVDDAEDSAQEVSLEYFISRGIEMPPEGWKLIAGTIEERGPEGEKHWLRLKPEDDEEERVEIRQAQPVVIETPRPSLTILIPGRWKTWLVSPDAQFGYWRDFNEEYHSIHDERCFDLAHQIAWAIAESEGLHGWLDVGDFTDLAAPSRHNPTMIDLHVQCLNKTWDRASMELAKRRHLVGDPGEVVVLDGNHDIRLRTKANQEMPYLVGMRRAGDPDDEHPVLTVPYMVRARDYGVEWMPSFPQGYRRLNGNLFAFHAPAYGSKALDTARKIAARVHASVIFGHTHRRESLAENIETVKGNRTLEIWSDGTFARTDGSLPAANNTYNEYGDRLLVGDLPPMWGMISQNMHQGLSVIHVETDERERFSVERVAMWDGWCSFRGVQFEAGCDAEGNTVDKELVAA